MVYIRATYAHSPPSCKLVAAKTRVAPIKQRTIPELELCGAVLLTELLENTMQTLNVPVENVVGWSDSTIVLCQLNHSPARYKTFVANRVAAATSVLPPSLWRHVPTADNPADCASRSVSAEELREHSLWWSGPPWLKMEPIAVPRQPQKSDLDSFRDHGAKPAACLVVSSTPTTWFEHKYHSYSKLLHVTARIKRAAFNFSASCRGQPQNKDERLSMNELKAAELFLLQSSQRRSFPAEVKQLTANPPKDLSSTSKLLHLRPILGQDGLLHIGGRLSKASIPTEQQHPIILSSRDVLLEVLFKYNHVLLSHCGPTLLISHVGKEWWEPEGWPGLCAASASPVGKWLPLPRSSRWDNYQQPGCNQLPPSSPLALTMLGHSS